MSDRTRRLAGSISQNRADLFWPAATGWFFFFVTPVLLGLVMREIFDAVEDPNSGVRPYTFLAVLVAIELVRRVVVHWSALGWVRAWTMMEAVPQANMLDSQVVGGGWWGREGRAAGRSSRRSGHRVSRRSSGRRMVRGQLDRRDRRCCVRGCWPASSCS